MVRAATRSAAFAIGRVAIWLHAVSYGFKPWNPRSAEALSAGIVLIWSWHLLNYPEMLQGRQYVPMLEIGSALAWARTGCVFSVLSLMALIGNGHWRPSPELRGIGAMYRATFWGALAHCYGVAIANGAADFPLRPAFSFLVTFEIYACLWCGIDSYIHRLKARQSGLTVRAGNG